MLGSLAEGHLLTYSLYLLGWVDGRFVASRCSTVWIINMIRWMDAWILSWGID